MEFFKKDKEKTSGRFPVSSEGRAERQTAVASDSGRLGAVDKAVSEPVSPPPQARPERPEPAPTPRAEPRPEPAPAPAPAPPPRYESTSRPSTMIPREPPVKETVIHADASFKGDLSFEGAMRVDGKIEGKITAKGRLTIGKGASIVGEAQVQSAVIEGSLKGNVTAAERVELGQSAHVVGDIKAPRLVVGEGAVLQGNVSIGGDVGGGETKSSSHLTDYKKSALTS